mmetsp:Transcript_38632/g.116757  ORF Transcript_38632/g.116757 Transcript_38632/m.116757 type:complete len:87 (+) Transcript_38632:64-324(+)
MSPVVTQIIDRVPAAETSDGCFFADALGPVTPATRQQPSSNCCLIIFERDFNDLCNFNVALSRKHLLESPAIEDLHASREERRSRC